MFQPEPSIPFIPVIREQVLSLVESINQPQVSVPGKMAQAVHGYLCGIRNGNGTLTIVVGLHLTKSGENVIYLHQNRQLTQDEYAEVEVEGLHFLESMGFMLDNLNFRNLAPEQQDATLKQVPLFLPPRPPSSAAPSAETRSGQETNSLARFLASF